MVAPAMTEASQLALGPAALPEPWSLADCTPDGPGWPPASRPSRTHAIDESALLHEMTASIAGASCVRDAIELILREICALTGWALGQAWTRNGGSYLECSPAWCARSEGRRSFRERGARMDFQPGVGLPGRPWP